MKIVLTPEPPPTGLRVDSARVPKGARAPRVRKAVQRFARPRAAAQTRVLIGYYLMGTTDPPAEFVDSLFELRRPPGARVVRQQARTQADGREGLARMAVEDGYTHVFMLDIDMTYPRDMLVDLLAADVDVVCGFALSRHTPHLPIFGPRGDKRWSYLPSWPTDTGRREGKLILGVLPSALVGGAGLLAKVSALVRIPRPWFTFPGEGEHGMAIGEDSYFSQKCEDNGVGTFVSTRHLVSHQVRAWIIPKWTPTDDGSGVVGDGGAGRWDMTVKNISALYDGASAQAQSNDEVVDPDPAQVEQPPIELAAGA